jgi:imidazolonepropionase
MTLFFKNIKKLLQVIEVSISFISGKQMNELPSIKNAYLVFKDV